MKILLLTDTPPGYRSGTGFLLKKLISFLPITQLAMCIPINSEISLDISIDLGKNPIMWLKKPRDRGRRLFLKGRVGNFVAFSFELIYTIWERYWLLPQIVNFAKLHEIDTLWVVFQGKTIVRLAKPLADKLKLPLHIQVCDSFEKQLLVNKLDDNSRRMLLKEFDEVVKLSMCCATTSWNMSKLYNTKYNIPNIPIIAGFPKEYAKLPAIQPNNSKMFTIAMAGQFYTGSEINILIEALAQVGWIIANRHIRLRVISNIFQVTTSGPVNFEYLGWHSQEHLVNLLADADLLYLPYSFSEEYRFETTNNFPSELAAYFAAGRPVFCHAPYYSSPIRYIVKYNAGFLCISEEPKVVLKALEDALTNQICYAEVAKNGMERFHRDFTIERMKETFFEFLRYTEAANNKYQISNIEKD